MHVNQQKKWTVVACLGAISYVLMYLAFPVIPLVPFLTLDFSDIPILLCFFIYGRKEGYLTILLKECLHFIMTGPSLPNFVGIVSNAIASILIAELIFSIYQKKQNWILAIVIATVALTIAMALINVSFMLPFYIKVLGMKLSVSIGKIVLFGIVPFNIIKGLVIGFIFKIMYQKINWSKLRI